MTLDFQFPQMEKLIYEDFKIFNAYQCVPVLIATSAKILIIYEDFQIQ